MRLTSSLWEHTVFELEKISEGLRYVALNEMPVSYEVISRDILIGPYVGLIPALTFQLGHPGIGKEGRGTSITCSMKHRGPLGPNQVHLQALNKFRGEYAVFEIEDVLSIADQVYEVAKSLEPLVGGHIGERLGRAEALLNLRDRFQELLSSEGMERTRAETLFKLDSLLSRLKNLQVGRGALSEDQEIQRVSDDKHREQFELMVDAYILEGKSRLKRERSWRRSQKNSLGKEQEDLLVLKTKAIVKRMRELKSAGGVENKEYLEAHNLFSRLGKILESGHGIPDEAARQEKLLDRASLPEFVQLVDNFLQRKVEPS